MNPNIPKEALKKVKINIDFLDGKRLEIRGKADLEKNAFDTTYMDLDNRQNPIVHLEDMHCEELAKLFYGLYMSFRDIQGDEEYIEERTVNLMEYYKKHDK